MKTQALRSHYDQFTAEERVELLLAALARGDADEVARLDETCPRVTVVAADPAYTNLRDRMWDAVVAVLYRWSDVSHRVVQARLTIALLNRRALCEVLEAVAPGARKKGTISPRTSRLGAEAQAQWTQWSAVWNAIEAAIMRFCGERGLTMEQLFAMVQCLPPEIDRARATLDADVSADAEAEAAVYQALRDTVYPQQASGRG